MFPWVMCECENRIVSFVFEIPEQIYVSFCGKQKLVGGSLPSHNVNQE